MPAGDQVLPSYIVLLLPQPNFGDEAVPLLIADLEVLAQSYSILPNILEQQLPHVLSHVLSRNLALSNRFLLLG